MKKQVSDMTKYIFSKSLLMNIHTTYHIYKIAVRRKCVWKYFFLREFSSAAPSRASINGAGLVGDREKSALIIKHGPILLK